MALTIEQKQKAIKRILAQFNFAKVVAVMTLINHRWQIDGQLAVPDIERLRTLCADLLNSACDSETASSSGGFTAFCDGQEVNLGYELESVAVEVEEAV